MDDRPAINTDRLTLRPPCLADFEETAAMFSDAEVVRYLGNRLMTREDGWARLLRQVGHWQIFGFGFWVVRERTSGRHVGNVGLGFFHREVKPTLGDSPEAGWVLERTAHGQGFATEAALAAHHWLEDRLGPQRTVCMIDPENAGSIRVATKCGYAEFARATYKDLPVILFERFPAACRS